MENKVQKTLNPIILRSTKCTYYAEWPILEIYTVHHIVGL